MSIGKQNKYSVGRLVVLERVEVFSEYVLFYDDGSCERFTYDKWGNRNSIEDRNGNKSYFVYDCFGKLITETKPDGLVIEREYDLRHQLTYEKDSAGREVIYTYDDCGRLLKEMVCLREVKEGSGDLYGADLMEERNASCVHVLSCKTLEKMAERARERVSAYAVTEYSYDANGNVVKVVLPEGGIISYTYDADDRLLSERHTESKGEIDNQILYTYDKADNLICLTAR